MQRYLGAVSLAVIFVCVTAIGQTAILYGPSVGIETAKKVASVAVGEAQRNHWYMAVAVVDTSGTLIYYEKMDNTQTGSARVSIDKARTAALYKRPSKAFQDMVAGGGTGLRILGLPDAVPIEGGVPLIVDDKVVGAIGVSGATADQDGICANAAANSLK
jgi:glc operon protein GlcG